MARRDQRRLALGLCALAIAAGGWLIQRAGADPAGTPAAPAAPVPRAAVPADRPELPASDLQRQFDAAVGLLIAGRHAQAVSALHRVLALAPRMPEAHVNMGYALLGLRRPRAARDFFDAALAIRPDQANAYYGLALAWEADGDLAMATGAMRSFLHLAQDQRPEHLRRARAALWEWEAARHAVPAEAPAPAASR